MRVRYILAVLLALIGTALASGPLATQADAAEVAEWHLEQPEPPSPPPTVEGGGTGKIGLGRVGDVEFWQPNRGVLITAGDGSTIPPGVWVYNGVKWRELSNRCGATNGRITWAGEEEFWTVSDGQPGQAAGPKGEEPDLKDNSLCHFAPEGGHLAIVKSYAHPAFQANSYQPIDAATCVEPPPASSNPPRSQNCWFGGASLAEGQTGASYAFHLHWNGGALSEEPDTHFKTVQSLAAFGGNLYESSGDPLEPAPEPKVLSEITLGSQFEPLQLENSSTQHLPGYEHETHAGGLAPFKLGAGEGGLWAAAGPAVNPPEKGKPGALTILYGGKEASSWNQVLGPETETGVSLKIVPAKVANDVVTSIAAEPGSASAWLALDTQQDASNPSPTASAVVMHVYSDGSIKSKAMTEEAEELPTAEERKAGVGPKGAAASITCPAPNECWLATTQGWLFHLRNNQALREDTAEAFKGPLITNRPEDEGLPQAPSDTLPKESGLEESHQTGSTAAFKVESEPPRFASVTVPLLSHVHSRLIHGSTLELGFHLAVEARIKLVAKRKRTVVASTPSRTLAAGNRSVRLKLNPKRWPTKLDLQTKALAPLPTVSSRSSSVESVSTGLAFPNHALALLTPGSSF